MCGVRLVGGNGGGLERELALEEKFLKIIIIIVMTKKRIFFLYTCYARLFFFSFFYSIWENVGMCVCVCFIWE